MVLCGVVVEEKQQHKLEEIGAKDSKQLTKKQRESLFKKIKDTAKSHYILIVEPKEIDEALESDSLNLNKLEAVKMAEIINYLQPDKVIIDCPSNNIRQFTNQVKQHLIHKKVEIRAEHKADANYPLVGAASILAKVTRDAEVDKIKKKIGIDFGSLPYDEEILIDNNGKICLEKIGLLVEEKSSNIKAFSLNTNDYSIKKYSVTDFIEHPKTNVYELELDFGKKIRLSKNHPLFYLNKDLDIIHKRLCKFAIGDHIAVCSNINNKTNLRFLDLVDILKNDSNKQSPLYVKISRMFIKKNEKNIRNILKSQGYVRTAYNGCINNQHLPLNIFSKLDSKINVKICSREDRICFNRYFRITKEFMWFLGIFIAEGWFTDYKTYIASADRSVISKIKRISNIYRINSFHNVHKKDIGLNSILLVKLLKRLVKGNNAYTKEIPSFIFSTNKNMIKAFVDGLYYGDGYLNEIDNWEIELRSKKIILQLQWLNLMMGNFSTNRTRKDRSAFITGIISKNSNSLCPYNLPSIAGAYIKRLRRDKNLSTKELAKKTGIDEAVISRIENQKGNSIQSKTIQKILKVIPDKKLTKLQNSNLCWLRIKKIKYVGKKKVYDLGVSYNDVENFLGGQAGIILHNSGYPADPKTDKFLKENFEKYPEIFRKTWASHKRLVKGLGQSKLNGF